MKKETLVLMSFVPFFSSFVADFFLSIPGIRVLFLFAMPVAMSIFWWVLGSLFARFKWPYWKAVLTAHSLGIVSVLVYYIMQLLPGSAPLLLSRLVQRFTLPISPWASYVYEFLGFPSSPDLFNTQAITVALLMMMLLFSLAFAIKKIRGTQRTARQF